MTTSEDLADISCSLLREGGTDAGEQVYSPGDWPSQDGQYPIIKIRIARESRQSLGHGGPAEFITRTTLRFSLEVSAPAQENDAGADVADAALWRLKRQVERILINNPALWALIQQFVSIDAQPTFNSDAATHLAGFQIDLTLEFFESAANFYQPETDDLHEIHAELSDHAPTGFTTNLTL